MQTSSKLNIEHATKLFWELQRQWNGTTNSKKYTVSDANKILRQILNAYNVPKALKRQARGLQSEIISNKRRKDRKELSADKVLQLTHNQ